jgi:hypothetical protein
MNAKAIHNRIIFIGSTVTAHPEPGIDPSLVVGGVAPASLVVSLASVFFILTVAVVIGLYVVYRRR